MIDTLKSWFSSVGSLLTAGRAATSSATAKKVASGLRTVDSAVAPATSFLGTVVGLFEGTLKGTSKYLGWIGTIVALAAAAVGLWWVTSSSRKTQHFESHKNDIDRALLARHMETQQGLDGPRDGRGPEEWRNAMAARRAGTPLRGNPGAVPDAQDLS